jgi:hypothetical protein
MTENVYRNQNLTFASCLSRFHRILHILLYHFPSASAPDLVAGGETVTQVLTATVTQVLTALHLGSPGLVSKGYDHARKHVPL